MNGRRTTIFPLKKLEATLRRDAAFVAWRYGRETRFASWEFPTGKSMRRVFIPPHSRKRLRDKKLNLGSSSVRFRQRLLRCSQRLVILLAIIIRLAERPMGLPPAWFHLQRFFERGDGLFVFPLVG